MHPTPRHEPVAAEPAPARMVRAKRVFLWSDEYDDIATVEELTGMDFSDLYHRFIAPQIRAAAALLREADNSGTSMRQEDLTDTWNRNLDWLSTYTPKSDHTPSADTENR